MSDRFVSLHRHTSFSLYDGLDLTVRSADRAAAMEQPAVAITDHGCCFGLIEHYRWVTDRGIKPIMGCEVYLVRSTEKDERRHHLTVLAMDNVGYENLMRMTTQAYQDMHYKPRVTMERLEEFSQGLIVLTGCPASYINVAIVEGRIDDAERHMIWLKGVFGDRLYVEVQQNERAKVTVPILVPMARQHGLKLVATNDAHYVEAVDKQAHDLLLGLRQKDKKSEGEAESATYGHGFHMPTRAEMGEMLQAVRLSGDDREEALDSTVEIAERVSFAFQKPSRMLPQLWGSDTSGQLAALAWSGLERLGKHSVPAYRERLQRELDVVALLGYDEYFLICREVADYSRGQKILIGPRGSVCGSLLAYVLGVTMVDPIVHGTIFERFLHDQKKSFPDVDLDFDSRHRDRVLEWVVARYAPYAIPIATFGRWGAGNVANDLSVALNLDAETTKRLRFAMEELKKARVFVAKESDLEQHAIFEYLEKHHPGITRVASRLYSQVRYIGRHPGGVCFVPDDNHKWFARAIVSGEEVTTCNFQDAEYVGLLKMDFLGLSSVSSVAGAVERIEERTGELIDLREVDLGDRRVLDMFAKGWTDGVFQFETRGAREILKGIEPESFQEVAAATALNRPGVSDNIPAYIAGKKGEVVSVATVERSEGGHDAIYDSAVGERGDHPEPGSPNGHGGGFDPRLLDNLIRDSLKDTHGTVVYQENTMALLRMLGFDWVDCDKFVKSLKDNTKTLALSVDEMQGKPVFRRLAEEIVSRFGADWDVAWAFVRRFSSYQFNKAHAIGYAMTAYLQMWLRVHHPLEFWCALLDAEHFEHRRRNYEVVASRDGVIFLPPHVNGTATYQVESSAIRVGLQSLKGVGEKAAQVVQSKRPYQSREHFLEVVPKRSVNSKVVGILDSVGALEFDVEKTIELGRAYNQRLVDTKPSLVVYEKAKEWDK